MSSVCYYEKNVGVIMTLFLKFSVICRVRDSMLHDIINYNKVSTAQQPE